MAYDVTLIPGDGVGPEVTGAAQRVLEATGLEFNWDVVDAGVTALERHGTVLPQSTLESIRRHGVALKGPVTTPVGTGFRSVNVAIRQALELYANLRPCKRLPGARSRYDTVDIVIVRENTEDLYAGIEFEVGSPEAKQLIAFVEGTGAGSIRPDSGISIKPISVHGTQRIVRFALEHARAQGRRRVTAVHKANIMKFSDGLFLSVARDVAQHYPDIQFDDIIIDNLCMQLVARPEEFDVLVLPNLYGDIVSDLCAGLVGGLGMAPGANIGADRAVFEPVHGSAPRHAGHNRVNPTAAILSGALMLRYLGEAEAADSVEQAVAAVIAEGRSVTYDFKPTRDDPTAVGTSQMADAIIERMTADA